MMFRFYDDELHNLILVANKSIKEIISYTANYDYHPPLQYLFNKIFLEIFGLNEFLLKLPSIILVIIAVILCSHLVFKVTGSVKLGLLCGIITLTNPLILLWGASIRWYPLWTFLAVFSIYLATILYSNSYIRKRIILQCILIFTLALALYTNYQTIILIAGIIITAFILDLKAGRKEFKNLKIILPVLIGVIILFLPYLNVFLNHIETFFYRKEIYSDYSINSAILAGCYFIFSILFGNSIYPWDIRFIVLISITIIALTGSIFYYQNHSSRIKFTIPKSILYQEKKNLLFLLTLISAILIILFLLQSIITGSFLSRSFLIFSFLLPILIIIYLYHLIKIKYKKFLFLLMITIVSFFLIWSISSYNVLTRQSLHKSGLMDPVEEVTSFIKNSIELNEPNSTIITYDPVLTYYLIKTNSLGSTVILSPYVSATKNLFSSVSPQINYYYADFDSSSTLIYIKSYPGSLIPLKDKIDILEEYIFQNGLLMEKRVKFGYDSDSYIKRKFFPSLGFIDWRFTINQFYPRSYWDKDALEEISKLVMH
jgi:uncharacterized membrane protein